MITSLSARNFRVLRNLDLGLKPLTLIVGPNSSGKSTILKALEGLSLCMAEEARPSYFGAGYDVIVSRRAEGVLRIGCSGEIGEHRFTFSLKIREDGALPPEGRWNRAELSMNSLREMRVAVRPAVPLNLDIRKLAAPSLPGDITANLPSDGTGLSWFLSGLYLEHPSRFREIVERLREIVPTVQDIRIRRAPLQEGGVGYEMIFDMKGADGVPAHSVSEGTLLTLGLLTALNSPEHPQLVLIDNLEQGLHPRALGDLVAQLRRIQAQDPELQIAATSHSPYLLDAVQPEEILLSSLDEDGYSVVRPLTDHPDYERWKDLMGPGEFWSTVGEGWVARAAGRVASS